MMGMMLLGVELFGEMHFKIRVIGFYFCALFLCMACGSVVDDPRTYYDARLFYPLDSQVLIYQVDSTLFDLEGTQRVQRTSSSFLRYRQVFESEQWWWRIDWKAADTSDWQFSERIGISEEQGDIWETQSAAILKKIDQPLFSGHSWEESVGVSPNYTVTLQGESFQPFSAPWIVEAEIKEDGYERNGFRFDRYLVKKMQPQDLLIEYRSMDEIYAQGVGLVFRQLYIADTQCEHRGGLLENCVDEAWEEKANRGYQMSMELIEIQ